MFSKRNDLSPDLKWMLQSHQVDDDTLVEALANKYYPRIFRAALTRLTYPEQAQRAAKETFVQAIIKSKTYRGAVNVSDWLDGIAVKICDDLSASQGTQQLLNPKLIQSIKNSRKEDELSPQQLELAIQEIKAEVHSRKTSGSKKITAQVLGLLGVITLVLLIMIGTRNYWTPDPFSEIPPSSLESGDEQSASEIVTRQQDIDQSDKAPSIEPLTLNSTSDEIRERIKSSSQYWDTLWLS